MDAVSGAGGTESASWDGESEHFVPTQAPWPNQGSPRHRADNETTPACSAAPGAAATAEEQNAWSSPLGPSSPTQPLLAPNSQRISATESAGDLEIQGSETLPSSSPQGSSLQATRSSGETDAADLLTQGLLLNLREMIKKAPVSSLEGVICMTHGLS